MFGPPFSSRRASVSFPITPPSQSWPVSFGLAGSETSYWRTSPCSQLAR